MGILPKVVMQVPQDRSTCQFPEGNRADTFLHLDNLARRFHPQGELVIAAQTTQGGAKVGVQSFLWKTIQ